MECHWVARGSVSASPSPTMDIAIRLGLSKTAPKECDKVYPNSPPSCMVPGSSGVQWLPKPPGNENDLKRFFIPSLS